LEFLLDSPLKCNQGFLYRLENSTGRLYLGAAKEFPLSLNIRMRPSTICVNEADHVAAPISYSISEGMLLIAHGYSTLGGPHDWVADEVPFSFEH
jgi:hypothetical protein